MAAAFERVIALQLDRFSPEEAKRRHIAIARRGLAAYLASQAEQPPDVTIEVDGHSAATEEAVKPFGVIVYRLGREREIRDYAKQQAERLSPVLSGRYQRSWFFLVGGAEAASPEIPPGATVILTNDQPYARKIFIGAKGFERYVPPGIVEKVRQLVLRKYRNVVEAEVEFVTLQGAHVLKKDLHRVRRGRRFGVARRDAMRGMEITYPALVLTPKRYA